MKKPTLRRTEAPQPIALSFFRHESEKTFRFQLPAFKSSKPRYWEIEISLPHCVLSKFLTHRIYKNNKWLFYTTKFWYNLLQSQRPTPDILHERYQISRHHMQYNPICGKILIQTKYVSVNVEIYMFVTIYLYVCMCFCICLSTQTIVWRDTQ